MQTPELTWSSKGGEKKGGLRPLKKEEATRNPPKQSHGCDRQVPSASPRFMARTKEKKKQGGEREGDWTSCSTVPADRMSQNV